MNPVLAAFVSVQEKSASSTQQVSGYSTVTLSYLHIPGVRHVLERCQKSSEQWQFRMIGRDKDSGYKSHVQVVMKRPFRLRVALGLFKSSARERPDEAPSMGADRNRPLDGCKTLQCVDTGQPRAALELPDSVCNSFRSAYCRYIRPTNYRKHYTPLCQPEYRAATQRFRRQPMYQKSWRCTNPRALSGKRLIQVEPKDARAMSRTAFSHTGDQCC